MKILITGMCGFVGSTFALEFKKHHPSWQIFGIDNLSRAGSEQNRHVFKRHGIRLFHGDIRNPSDLEILPPVDWILDSAANPSVLAGVSGETSSRQLIEHNLIGTINLLEFCKRHKSGFLMLSTSRVYSIKRLARLPMEVKGGAFTPKFSEIKEVGVTEQGITEEFSTEPPLSLYGSSKLASETLALEYGEAFGFPVYINRCGVLAGAGQFGKADQGIFSFWIHSYCHRKPLKYIGFDGQGHQTRDCLHPKDLLPLLEKQINSVQQQERILNVSGGIENGVSLAQLSAWCAKRFGEHQIASQQEDRVYDIPWLVLNSSKLDKRWGWQPLIKSDAIFEEIAIHAEKHLDWLDQST